WGAKDVASEMPVHASQLYAMNIAALAGLLVKDGEFVVDLEDEILDGCAVVHDGEVRNEVAQQALQGGA
ncbi:MAG: NAD(P)(+) transhydrogenase (Re/Si-specific) subunit alpha, partial [Candidatus Nanopelagicales bacterium]